MQTISTSLPIIYTQKIPDLGSIELRPFSLEEDLPMIYKWVTQDYASFWGMQYKSYDEVQGEYITALAKSDYKIFIGLFNGKPSFLLEKYKVSEDRIRNYYQAEAGDYGMHILVAPPVQRIQNFTWTVFKTVVEFFFSQPEVIRMVVEPDINNEKIHRLNKKAGFQYIKEIDLPEKKAGLAICSRQTFKDALEILQINEVSEKNPKKTSYGTSVEYWNLSNKELVAKAISEFAHELLLQPESQEDGTYILKTGTLEIYYQFKAKKYALDHWSIAADSLQKFKNSEIIKVEALSFFIEFQKVLGITDDCLPVYLEEISSTLNSAIYKKIHQQCTAKDLANASFQKIEQSMTEGHPVFVANNGRIGFSRTEYLQYAPEVHQPFHICWLAGHISKTTYASVSGFGYNAMMHKELGVEKIAEFNSVLKTLRLPIQDYIFIPVHPWQWNHKIQQVFATDLANQKLVYLGESKDAYVAQQSIRTLFSQTHPDNMYVKTALSILNMGFMRGLSPYYMKTTPEITTWITDLLGNDTYLKRTGFDMLGEVATVGFENTYYQSLGRSNPHNKMLSALWRESPQQKIKQHQNVMTMAALIHRDKEGNALIAAMIKASRISPQDWLQTYLDAYLKPLLHCFYAYELVFIPHGENIILIMEDQVPVRILMKDITEEIIVFDPELVLPEAVQRVFTPASDEMKVLSLFTDIFDGFFRFLSVILEEQLQFSEIGFWKQVATTVHTYQAENKHLQKQFERYDLFMPEFGRCCLNRLQLRNTKQMLNLADPIESLIIEGTIKNPIASFKNTIA
ncbi:GNAT family N-acetyltransferase [Aquimarina sp. ERC-38]|uniref:GNAT family N-acetyltransferase n=1 Tax=Aquimarina sp. ERC-38 TaxID=2949996 RepID=UPI00224839A5|nr:GNAT family N-acetyltransferase [Aquimarina sp. ERC-38]UZO80635.1 GNAT family N-acetyltransferase [Aquimarina sp. ERC-38]